MRTGLEMPLPMVLPGIKNIKIQGNTTYYEIEPLEPGYGMTIAHALKRVLVSSLSGAAIIALQIEGISSKEQRIPGVEERVTDILLNMKQVRLRCFSPSTILMHLYVTGKREVTAADIIVPDTIEIMNPGCHIANLIGEDTHLALEMVAQVGKGYVPAIGETDERGFLLDAIYTPIRRVNYTVEHTRVGKMVNFDKILLEVETDGTLTPDEALRQSGYILQHHFLALTQSSTSEPRKPGQSSVPIPLEIYNLPLEQLGLPIRSYNALKRYGFMTKVGHILVQDEKELRDIHNVGDKVLMDIKDHLQDNAYLPQID